MTHSDYIITTGVSLTGEAFTRREIEGASVEYSIDGATWWGTVREARDHFVSVNKKVETSTHDARAAAGASHEGSRGAAGEAEG